MYCNFFLSQTHIAANARSEVMTDCCGREHVEVLSAALIVTVEGPAANTLHAKKIQSKFSQVIDQYS